MRVALSMNILNTQTWPKNGMPCDFCLSWKHRSATVSANSQPSVEFLAQSLCGCATHVTITHQIFGRIKTSDCFRLNVLNACLLPLKYGDPLWWSFKGISWRDFSGGLGLGPLWTHFLCATHKHAMTGLPRSH